MGHVEIIADHYFLFSSRILLSHMPISSVPKCAKPISARNCTSGSLSQVSTIDVRIKSKNSGDLLNFTLLRMCHDSVAAAPLMAPYDSQDFTLLKGAMNSRYHVAVECRQKKHMMEIDIQWFNNYKK